MNTSIPTSTILLILLLCLSACLSDQQSGDLLVDENGLLTDLALAVQADPDIGQIDPDYRSWIENEALPIRSLESSHFTDLEEILPALSNKRIIALGASAQGVQEFDLISLRLIKFLHQKQGFEVLCLPARYFDIWLGVSQLQEKDAEDCLKTAIGEPARTALKELFEYARQCQNTAKPLYIQGIDIATGVHKNDLNRSLQFQQALHLLQEHDYAQDVYLHDQLFAAADAMPYDARLNWLEEFGMEYTTFYDNLHTFFWNQQQQLLDLTDQADLVHLVLRTSWDMAQYLRYMSSDTNHDGLRDEEMRNRAMANQVKFLLDEKYPVSRIMIWSSDENIRYHNKDILSGSGNKSMMAFIEEHFPMESYSLAMYMNRGHISRVDRSIYALPSAPDHSLEAHLFHAGWSYSFLDLHDQVPSPGNQWIFEEVQTRQEGQAVLKLIPTQQYDGLIFVDEVSPSIFF